MHRRVGGKSIPAHASKALKRPRVASPSVVDEDDDESSAPDADEDDESWHHEISEEHCNGVWLTRDLYHRCALHFSQDDWEKLSWEQLDISQEDDEHDTRQQIQNEAEHLLERYERSEDSNDEDGEEEDGEDGEDGEEEDEEEDDGEEEEDGAQAQATPQGIAGLQATLQRVKAELAEKTKIATQFQTALDKTTMERDALAKENARLTRAVAALEQEANVAADGGDDDGMPQNEGENNAQTPASSLRMLHKPGKRNVDDFALAFCMPPGYKTVALPYSYKKSEYHFPHMIQQGSGRSPVYIVESRNQVHVLCELRNCVLKRPATEADLLSNGQVFYKLELCYASTGNVVQGEELSHSPQNLFDPADTRCKMVNGQLKWRFKLKVLSRSTRNPSNQQFLFKISCVNPELSQYDLGTESVPFRVISREVKEEKKDGGGDDA